MKKTVFSIALLATLTFAQTSQAANPHDPGVNHRQQHQGKRIVQGARSGQLTGRETFRLAKQQKNIRSKERRFKSDGHLSKRERAALHRDLNKANKTIYRQKHDRQRR